MKRDSARKAILLTLATVVLTLGLAGSAAAAGENTTKSSSINVSVSSSVAVDLHPESLEYSNLGVGVQENNSDRGFTGVNLENTGSEYIKKIWVSSTKPTSDPFGTGTASNYNAGNFLQLRPGNSSGLLLGDTTEYNYVNRIEYAVYANDQFPSYIEAPDDQNYALNGGGESSAVSDVAVGRFRMGDVEYFFAIPNNGVCDGSGSASLLVAKEPHTAEQTTPVDFTNDSTTDDGFPGISGKDYVVYDIKADTTSPYGVTGAGPSDGENGVTLRLNEGTASEINRTYDVLTQCDTSGNGGVDVGTDVPRTIRTRYNVEGGGSADITANGGTATSYLLNTDDPANMLKPGDFVTFETAVEVPRGVTQGSMTQGTLTVYVTADVNAN